VRTLGDQAGQRGQPASRHCDDLDHRPVATCGYPAKAALMPTDHSVNDLSQILSGVMVEVTTPEPSQGPAPGASREESFVWAAVCVGVCVAFVGLIDGLMMAFKRHVAPCPDGKYFPEGTTNFNCYVHPQGGLGTAIAVFSVLLATVVVLCGMSAAATLRTGSATGASVR
jgi:hypothetical protein